MNIVDAIDDPQVFGKHFRQVRATMQTIVRAANREAAGFVAICVSGRGCIARQQPRRLGIDWRA
jgi:hypothetical protein